VGGKFLRSLKDAWFGMRSDSEGLLRFEFVCDQQLIYHVGYVQQKLGAKWEDQAFFTKIPLLFRGPVSIMDFQWGGSVGTQKKDFRYIFATVEAGAVLFV
jgi:hypothetical protein